MSNNITLSKLSASAVDVSAAKDLEQLKHILQKILLEVDNALKEISDRLIAGGH